ncbi:zinc finger protein 43-like isoform X1 [Myxocyprinus asiaticus]|uniref:zinc finger protein 43-like isoform X1 n=2 Tax=Myxocyprinus asiaticus TaxID=70543 RepID=UPI002222959E|nr:zinc finger protein 43-like isoform X1 [Myxocyprinus asiaticus]XP_051576950.1 zinc finger protein 43-like isoform X1 [Myxocyprinus asiaticus]XP_051576951.1 zinc finger protein 43-like isoform X1 [Myxocyprinus asiaticus]XP_051576953.1 zinc finger protein 43-like isoform X1 [Myxocyprinus asiaticus]
MSKSEFCFVKMAYSMDCIQELIGGDVFICTECGEGFRQYPKLVEHMAIHGLAGLFFPDVLNSSNDSSINTSIEFALHENGTLTVVDRSVLSKFSFLFGKPASKSSWCQTPNQGALTSSKMAEKECNQFKCERCGQVFKNQKSLHLHQQYRALEQGFKCTLCCKVFNDRESLQSHLQNHAHERFYSCGHCGKRFLRKETLLSHQKQGHGSLGPKALIEEEQENRMDRSYPCKICGLCFFWLSDLQSHLNSHSRVSKSPSDPTRELKILEEKESKMNGSDSLDLPYRCGLCGVDFNQMSELKDHHASQHPDKDEVQDSSDSLAKIKRQSFGHSGIIRQMVSKSQVRQFDPLRSRMRGRPRGANRLHFAGKLYSCKLCHCAFVHSSSLSRHMRYHKGTLHACVYCGKRFPQRCDLTRHVAIHHSSALLPKACGVSKTESRDESSKQELVKASTPTKGDKDNEREAHEEETSLSYSSLQKKMHLSYDELSLDSEERRTFKPKMSYKCKECCRVFGLLSVYQRHVNFHKRDPSKILLSCPCCPCRFTFRSALDRHLEQQHNDGSVKDSTKSPEINLVDSTI